MISEPTGLRNQRNQTTIITMTEEAWCSAIQRYIGPEYNIKSLRFLDEKGNQIDAPHRTVATAERCARSTPATKQEPGIFRSMLTVDFAWKTALVVALVHGLYQAVKQWMF